jgi:hypothetical protein
MWKTGFPKQKVNILHRVLHLTRNPPRRHAAAAAGIELIATRNSRRMLVGGFRVMWDYLYKNFLTYFRLNSELCIIDVLTVYRREILLVPILNWQVIKNKIDTKILRLYQVKDLHSY